jgi:hypothetical protein
LIDKDPIIGAFILGFQHHHDIRQIVGRFSAGEQWRLDRYLAGDDFEAFGVVRVRISLLFKDDHVEATADAFRGA